jgi:2-polyprenyl-3-methyl-5-hydroxy-6-metoxy-1,4-benzoquinol methylase
MNPDESSAGTSCLVCGVFQSHALYRGDFVYYRCSNCGLVSSAPIPTAEQIQAHYKSKFASGNYETARRYAVPYRRVHRQLANFVDPTPGDRILDVGCFTGELLSLLAARGADVYGLELQPEAVEIANERLAGRVYQADVFGTSFPKGPYDVVTMMGFIEHVTEPTAFLDRANVLLKQGGRLVLETPDAGSFVARLAGAHWPPLAPIEHIHLFSRRALRIVLAQSGFRNIRFRAHVKMLPVGYVYEMLQHFGPEWRALLKPVNTLLHNLPFPFYVGEIMVSATKS